MFANDFFENLISKGDFYMGANIKKIFSFEFWQKFGKALMVVIAVMLAAGLMISIGKLIAMAQISLAVTIGGVTENIGWAIIGNLPILFALAIDWWIIG